MPIYTFTCGEHGEFDSREAYGTDVVHCACGKASSRVSVYRVNFGGYASTPLQGRDYSRQYQRFVEASGEIDHQVSKVEASTGSTYNSPLFKVAKAKAADMMAKGATGDDL